MVLCHVCGKKQHAKSLCKRHYYQIYNYGKLLERSRADRNEIVDCGEYAEIILYNVKHQEIARAKIDRDDIEKVSPHKWGVHKAKILYANSCIQGKQMTLHRLVMNAGEGDIVDHINGDGLDNRHKNLRFVTHSQNLMNMRKLRGVSWDSTRRKYKVAINVNKKTINIGRFITEIEARKAREEAERKYFGEYASTQRAA